MPAALDYTTHGITIQVGHLPRELAKLLTSVPETSMHCVVAQDTPVYTKGLDIPINLTITVLPLDKSLVRKLRKFVNN